MSTGCFLNASEKNKNDEIKLEGTPVWKRKFSGRSYLTWVSEESESDIHVDESYAFQSARRLQ